MQARTRTKARRKTKTTRSAIVSNSSRAFSFLRSSFLAAASYLSHLLDLLEGLLDFCFLLVDHIGVVRALIKLARTHLQAERVLHRAVVIHAALAQNFQRGVQLGDGFGKVLAGALGGKHRGDLLREIVAFGEDGAHVMVQGVF